MVFLKSKVLGTTNTLMAALRANDEPHLGFDTFQDSAVVL